MIPKFRAWDKEEKRWADISSFEFSGDGKLMFVEAYIDDVLYFTSTLGEAWELLRCFSFKTARDHDVEVCEGDIIEAATGITRKDSDIFIPVSIYRGVVSYGEYEQDGSAGEYGGSKCFGLYGEFFTELDSDDRTPMKIERWERQQSLLEFDVVEVIGNIYENPELIEK